MARVFVIMRLTRYLLRYRGRLPEFRGLQQNVNVHYIPSTNGHFKRGLLFLHVLSSPAPPPPLFPPFQLKSLPHLHYLTEKKKCENLLSSGCCSLADWFCGVMVSTLDSESSDPSSNLGRT